MQRKWDFEPVMENMVGWNLIKAATNEDEISNNIGMVYVMEDLEESKSNISLISTAPELLEVCKKALEHVGKNSSLYEELVLTINKAEGLEGEFEKLDYFDDKEGLKQNFVLNMDFKEDKLTFIPESKMSDLFSFEDFDDNVGLIKINLSGDYIYEGEDGSYDLRYPIGHILSKKVFDDYVKFMNGKFASLEEFMADFDKQEEDVSLHMFIYDMFFDEFASDYTRKLNLKDYLEKYPLMHDTESLYIALNIPKFLEDCPHTVHVDMEVECNGQTTKGIIFYKEKEKKFFVYNVENKSIAFFMINNTDEDKENTLLEFIDLVQK